MKKRYAAMILLLPTLAVLVLSVFVLGFQGFFAGGIVIVEIPLYVWYLLGVVGCRLSRKQLAAARHRPARPGTVCHDRRERERVQPILDDCANF